MKALWSWTSAWVIGFHASFAFAQHKEADFHYPELEVVPRASQRVMDEAKYEKSSAWREQIPLLVPALANVVAGMSARQEKATEPHQDLSKSRDAGTVALSVGTFWLGTSAYFALVQSPYQDAAAELKKRSSKDKRQELSRERFAEESIESAARLGRWVKYMSFLSNLAAGLAVTDAAHSNGAKVAGGVAALSSTLPLFFPTRWQLVDDWHKDYKKKIYAPVTAVEWQRLPSGKWGPQWSVAWQF